MKKSALIATIAAISVSWLGSGASAARAQGNDAIDPIYALSLPEAINDKKPGAVLEHFVSGATVVFDNTAFGTPNRTLTAAEYAARQDPNEPDVPTDIHLEIVDG